MSEFPEDELLEDPGIGIMIITIVCDDAELAPRVDLDNCHPALALTILSKAIEAIDATMPIPTIYYKGEKIAESMLLYDEDDDD